MQIVSPALMFRERRITIDRERNFVDVCRGDSPQYPKKWTRGLQPIRWADFRDSQKREDIKASSYPTFVRPQAALVVGSSRNDS
jgi:hypothetical protein